MKKETNYDAPSFKVVSFVAGNVLCGSDKGKNALTNWEEEDDTIF